MNLERGLLGAGGQADEASEFDPHRTVVFRAVTRDRLDPARPGVIDIATRDEAYTSIPVTAAVGMPGLRRTFVESWNGTLFDSIVSPHALLSPSSEVGDGCIVGPGAVMTAGARLGSHVILNVGASVSHGSVVGDYATIGPGARIAGDCVIGDGAFIGIGASVSHGVRVSPGAVLGAGAVVVDDILLPGVYAGVPARLIRPLTSWITSL